MLRRVKGAVSVSSLRRCRPLIGIRFLFPAARVSPARGGHRARAPQNRFKNRFVFFFSLVKFTQVGSSDDTASLYWAAFKPLF